MVKHLEIGCLGGLSAPPLQHSCHSRAATFNRQRVSGTLGKPLTFTGSHRLFEAVQPASDRQCHCKSLSTSSLPAVAQETIQLFVENTLARDAAATVAAMIGGLTLVKSFDYLASAGVLDKVMPLTFTCCIFATWVVKIQDRLLSCKLHGDPQPSFIDIHRTKSHGGMFLAICFGVCVLQKVSRKLVHILAGPGLMLAWPLFR